MCFLVVPCKGFVSLGPPNKIDLFTKWNTRSKVQNLLCTYDRVDLLIACSLKLLRHTDLKYIAKILHFIKLFSINWSPVNSYDLILSRAVANTLLWEIEVLGTPQIFHLATRR